MGVVVATLVRIIEAVSGPGAAQLLRQGVKTGGPGSGPRPGAGRDSFTGKKVSGPLDFSGKPFKGPLQGPAKGEPVNPKGPIPKFSKSTRSSETVPSEKVPTGGHDDTGNVPVGSFRDDVQRKKALKKVMGPSKDESEGGPGSGPRTGYAVRSHGHDPRGGRNAPSKPSQGKEPPRQTGYPVRSHGYDPRGVGPTRGSEAVPSSFSDEPAGMDDTTDLDSVGMGSDDDDASGTGQGDQWTKEEVNYRYSGDKEQNCGNCVHFKYPGACEIISGLIRVVDVCDKFESADKSSSFGWENPNPAEDDDNVVQSELVRGGGGMGGSYGVVASEVVEAPASTWGMMTKEVDFWPVEDKGNAVHAGGRVLRGPAQRGDGPRGQRDSLKKGPLWTGEGGPGSGPQGGGGKKYPMGPGAGSRVAVKKSTRGMNREDADDIADTVNSEVAPPGWEGTVKRMKKHPEITNPWALAWYMKGKGDTSHVKSALTTESLVQQIAMGIARLEEAGVTRRAPFASSRRK